MPEFMGNKVPFVLLWVTAKKRMQHPTRLLEALGM
jgi:hypothetical protein